MSVRQEAEFNEQRSAVREITLVKFRSYITNQASQVRLNPGNRRSKKFHCHPVTPTDRGHYGFRLEIRNLLTITYVSHCVKVSLTGVTLHWALTESRLCMTRDRSEFLFAQDGFDLGLERGSFLVNKMPHQDTIDWTSPQA